MGFGQRRGGGHRGRHHHNRHRNNHHFHGNRHHHGHAVNLTGLFYRRGNSPGHPLQRRMWSGLTLILMGLAMFMYGAVNTAINSSYRYSYQGTIFMGIGAVLALCGIIVTVKMYQMYKLQLGTGAPQSPGSAVVIQSGPGVNATPAMQQQQQTNSMWITGQSGSATAPPPGYGQLPPGYPMGYPVGPYPPEYPPGGQPMYPLPNGEHPYNQPPPPGGVPPPPPPQAWQSGMQPPGGVPPPPPPQAWQGGMQPGPTDGTQFYQVQPAYQQPDQMTAHPPVNDSQGPQSFPADDTAPPSYDEATKNQQIP